jgi:hypothetical protein
MDEGSMLGIFEILSPEKLEKNSYRLVKNESYQICTNIWKPNLAYFTSILQKNWLKMIVKKLVLSNYTDEK